MRAQAENEAAVRAKAERDAQVRAQQSTQRAKAEADWIRSIQAKVRGNVIVPPDMAGNPEAIFEVVQLPTGEIIDVQLKKSSGVRAYDDAVQRAILKSSPLPRPERGGPLPALVDAQVPSNRLNGEQLSVIACLWLVSRGYARVLIAPPRAPHRHFPHAERCGEALWWPCRRRQAIDDYPNRRACSVAWCLAARQDQIC